MGGARRGAAGIRPKVVAGVFADAQTVRPYIQYADVMNIKGCTVVQPYVRRHGLRGDAS